MVNPVTRIGLDGPVAKPSVPPFEDTQVAVYAVIALPPSLDGAENATESEPFAGVALPIVGAFGAVGAGTTAFDTAEATPVPIVFFAVTLHV